MSFQRAGINGVCLLIVACTSERAPNPDRSPSAILRSESTKTLIPSDPNALASLLAVPVDSLRAAGEERYGRQEYDSARAIWRVELARADGVGDARAAARVRMWLGLAAWRLGDFKSARFEGEKSLTLKRELRMDAELARSFNALGLLAWHEGRFRDALQHFDSAKIAATRNHDQTGVARALLNTPLIQVELGDFDTARKGFLRAVAAAKVLDDDLMQGNALANLAMLEIRLGNAAGAVNLLGRARARYKAIEYRTGESNALGQLATAWSQLGDLQQAIAAADSALVMARAEGLQQEVAAELEVLADLHLQAGSPRLALRLLAEADSIDKAVGLKAERGTNFRRVAAILTELGEYPAAIMRARQAVAVHREVLAEAEEIYDRLQVARLLSLNQQPTEARAEVDSAALYAGRARNPSIIKAVSAMAARLDLDSKDPKRALTDLGRAGSSAPTDWPVADLRAQALFALGRLDEARKEGERAISGLEHERGSLGTGPLRSLYLATRASPFSHLVAVHLARHDTAAAFAVASSLPGRDLSERFSGFVDAPRSLLAVAEAEGLLLRAAAIDSALSALERDATTSERARALESELAAVRNRYEEQVARHAALPQAPMLGLATVSLQSVQSSLRDDEAVLTFLSGPDRLDVFVVRRGFLRHTSSALGDRALGQRVRLARELLGGPKRSSEVSKALGDLYELVIGGAERARSLAGVKRLLIVPHGSLGALPFGALWNRQTGKFLIEEQIVSFLPSVAALTVEPREPRPISGRLLAFAPLSDSLPGTVREVRAIASVRPGTEMRIGSASTEPGVKAALVAGALLHIASHGSHNSQNPLFSRMVVSTTRHGSANDGHLDVHEILELQTRSPLVFLSGCETGLGSGMQSAFEQSSEEGSLAQAFLVAGAKTVVATLWRVDDAESVELAKTFYRQIRSGATPAQALASAQRYAIRGQSAYSWAAYTASGR